LIHRSPGREKGYTNARWVSRRGQTREKELEVSLPKRSEIRPGLRVQVIEKHNQGSGALTEGVVRQILTNSPSHPHGIKVRLEDGKVGRVQAILQ
jgi:uncharacterized repeat protein (TIGR03833 family)